MMSIAQVVPQISEQYYLIELDLFMTLNELLHVTQSYGVIDDIFVVRGLLVDDRGLD